jgi:outer membrane immunogenic protein
MRSNVKIFATAVGLFATATIAQAADLSVPPARVAAPVPYTWSGLYIGLNAGYTGGTLTETASGAATGSASASIPGGVGGFQLGANYQINAIVLGFEADFDGAAATRSVNFAGGLASNSAQLPWMATFRGRAGVAFDRLLFYATVGGVATELVSTVNVTGIGTASTNFTHSGWTAGGGLEAAISNDLSAKIEYLYFDTGNGSVASVGGPPPVTFSGRLKDSLVRAGLNYRLPVAW